MIRVFLLAAFLMLSALPLRAENIDDPYRNPTGISWWQQQINRSPWLREKTGGQFRFQRSMAIVIGIGDYDDGSGWGKLASPINDAKTMRTFLQSSGFDEVHTLTNASATRERLDALISYAEATLGPDDRFFFYWSGHGGRGDNGDGTEFGFLPFAGTSTTGRGPTVSMSEFRIWAQRIKARHTLFVLDSCFSGQALPATRTNRTITHERLSKRADYVFTSSSSGQESYGYRDGGGGLFTRAFLGAVGALEGQTAADYDQDGFVTLAEIEVAVKRTLDDASGSYPFIMSPQVSAIGATSGEFFFVAPTAPPTPEPAPDPAPRPVVSLGADPCVGANAEYELFVRNARQCWEVEAYLETHSTASSCTAVRAAQQRKIDLCEQVSETQAPPARIEKYADLSSFRDDLGNGVKGPEMVVIPAGRFMMGSPESEWGRFDDEGPQRAVTVGRFALGRTEVTFDDWQACVDAGGCKSNLLPDDKGWGRGSRPVINVSWDDAQEYIAWLNGRVEGAPYRLPTEAEWEYAARAGTVTPFWTGETVSTDQANYDGNHVYGNGREGIYRGKTLPVGILNTPNPFGLHDVHGNVWEWAQDCHTSYSNAPVDGTAYSPLGCSLRVRRGGSWVSNPRLLRSAYRVRYVPDDRFWDIGFRLARTLTP